VISGKEANPGIADVYGCTEVDFARRIIYKTKMYDIQGKFSQALPSVDSVLK
jgi:hypothetical protein